MKLWSKWYVRCKCCGAQVYAGPWRWMAEAVVGSLGRRQAEGLDLDMGPLEVIEGNRA